MSIKLGQHMNIHQSAHRRHQLLGSFSFPPFIPWAMTLRLSSPAKRTG
jgi:hypothetical protein